MKQPHEYWYYFGCIPHPVQIKKGWLPNPPFKRFETKRDCKRYIDNKNEFSALKLMMETGKK